MGEHPSGQEDLTTEIARDDSPAPIGGRLGMAIRLGGPTTTPAQGLLAKLKS